MSNGYPNQGILPIPNIEVNPLVTIPDVFPLGELADIEHIHDIIKGSIPTEKQFAERANAGVVEAWIILAQATKEIPAYTDPPRTYESRPHSIDLYRPRVALPITVEAVSDEPRKEMRLIEALGDIGIRIPGSHMVDKDVSRVETARYFTGTVNTQESTARITGVHFSSGHLLGWAKIWQD